MPGSTISLVAMWGFCHTSDYLTVTHMCYKELTNTLKHNIVNFFNNFKNIDNKKIEVQYICDVYIAKKVTISKEMV